MTDGQSELDMSRWLTNGLLALVFIGLGAMVQELRFEPLDRTGLDNTSHWVFDRLIGRLCVVRRIGEQPICDEKQFLDLYKQ